MKSRFGTALFVVILAAVVPARAVSGDDNTESETSTNGSALTVHVTPTHAFAPARVRAVVRISARTRETDVSASSSIQAVTTRAATSSLTELTHRKS